MTHSIECNKDWFVSPDKISWNKAELPCHVFTEPETVESPVTGKVFFRRTFSAPEEWRDKNVYMEIGAAMQRSAVSVNGIYQFTHFGGYQKFFIPLSNVLEYGKDNTVEIELDNTPSFDMPPGKQVSGLDFCYYSGLHRYARIRIFEEVHFSDELAVSIPAGGGVFIRTESLSENRAELALTCHVMNEVPPNRWSGFRKPDARVHAEVRITGPDGKEIWAGTSGDVTLPANKDHIFEMKAAVRHPSCWSPASPSLYRAEFRLFRDGNLMETRIERFGIRTVEFRRDGFFLNGKLLRIEGTNRHSEYPFVGNAVPANGQKRDAKIIKETGLNFVRLCHYNQSEDFLNACDELGLMVMPAIPGWQAYHPNGAFIQNAFRDVRELVRSLRNHPSVILWEVSLNESYPPSWFNEQLHRIAHEEYPGCFTAGDTYGKYTGWDVLFPSPGIDTGTKPLLLREYGDWTFGGNESTSRAGRGADVKARLVQTWNFLWSLNRLYAVEGMTGGADWVFFDYNRGCARGVEESGSYDLFRLPKLKAEFYRSQGSHVPMIHAVHDGDEKLVVFSNCAEIEIRRNGKSVCRRGPDSGPDTPYGANGSPGWETALPEGFDKTGGEPFNGGNVRNLRHPPFTFNGIPALEDGEVMTLTGFTDGRKMAETTLRKPGKAVRAETVLRDEGIPVVPGDLVFADIVLKDANGITVPDNGTRVSLEVSGGESVGPAEKTTLAGVASFLLRVHSPSELALRAHVR